MAGVLLEQALEALQDSACPRALKRPVPSMLSRMPFDRERQERSAHNRRIRLLRESVLFSAFACEAYANEWLSASFANSDRDALDRLPTVEKLLLTPPIAGHAAVLSRSSEPYQTLARLFKARNQLAHPKPGQVNAYVSDDAESDAEWFGPQAAACYVVAVAHAAVLMRAIRTDEHSSWPAVSIYEHREVVLDHVERTGAGMTDLPAPDAEPAFDLFQEIHRLATAKHGPPQDQSRGRGPCGRPT
jgi:hypothetical protein